MFCPHKWKLLTETKTESDVEQLKRLGKTTSHIYAGMLRRKLIQVFCCDKCGKIKKMVEEI